MSNLDRRGDYRPKRQREREAYRLVLVGGGTGAAGLVALVLAVAGVTGAFPPIILLLIAVFCAWRFRRLTGQS